MYTKHGSRCCKWIFMVVHSKGCIYHAYCIFIMEGYTYALKAVFLIMYPIIILRKKIYCVCYTYTCTLKIIMMYYTIHRYINALLNSRSVWFSTSEWSSYIEQSLSSPHTYRSCIRSRGGWSSWWLAKWTVSSCCWYSICTACLRFHSRLHIFWQVCSCVFSV